MTPVETFDDYFPQTPQDHYHEDYYKAQARPNEIASVVFNDFQTALLIADRMHDRDCDDYHADAWGTAEAMGTTVFVRGLSQELVESWGAHLLMDCPMDL